MIDPLKRKQELYDIFGKENADKIIKVAEESVSYRIDILKEKSRLRAAGVDENSIRRVDAIRKLNRIDYVGEIIDSSKKASKIFEHLKYLEHEEFWVACFNRRNKLLLVRQISIGNETSTTVGVKEIINLISQSRASGAIVAHNHPSNSLIPSSGDIQISKKIKIALKSIDSVLMDSLIVSRMGYCSLADDGYL